MKKDSKEPDSPESNLAVPEPGALAVPTARHDGWTAERQKAFLAALAETACVRESCRRVGMSHVSAYALRARPSAIAFRAAWDAALDHAVNRLEEAALSRALNGVPRPVFYKGEQVGEWRHFDERLTMFLLRYQSPLRFGASLDAPPPPDPEEHDPMGRLDWHLDELTDDCDPPHVAPGSGLEGGNFGNFDGGAECSDAAAQLPSPVDESRDQSTGRLALRAHAVPARPA